MELVTDERVLRREDACAVPALHLRVSVATAALYGRPMPPAARSRSTTARRIVLAFAAILALFGLALVVMIVALGQIADAERDVARLDHVKHAGHSAAAMAREQYIHQAHTLLEWNESHLDHYEDVAREARGVTEHLREMVGPGPNAPRAEEIARLVAESDRRFREEVVPVVRTSARNRVTELHEMTERPVAQVVALNEELNRSLEAASDAAQRRAEAIRSQVRLLVLAQFALAILLAAAVGVYLMRSISRPVAALRAGALRIGAGDLTARVGLAGNDELTDLAKVFDQMAEDLTRHQAQALEAHRLASIGQVASGVAHEVNNPLGVILGYVALLRREAALADREELRIIEDEARQCQAIVAGLLDLARPVRLHASDVELGEVVREAVARLEESGQATGVTIAVDGEARTRVVGDEGKLRQIVSNLLGNAVEAARDPAATGPDVVVRWDVHGDRVCLHVDDRGPGVSAESLPRVFEPFFTTRARGHGLGLAIARSLARAHGGDVTLAHRTDGPGMRATLAVPLRAAGSAT